MKIKSIFLFASTLLLSICSCTAPAVEEAPALDLEKIKAEIQAMEDAYAIAQNAKNADGVMVYYADDAVNMPYNQPTAIGKEAILTRVKEEMAKDTSGATIVFKVTDIKACGDLVVEAGTSASTDAKGKVTTGKYVSVFERRDGKYVCIRDIWNDDAPNDKN